MDFFIGLINIGLGIYIALVAAGFPRLAGLEKFPGPGLFPQILGVLLAITGIILVADQIRNKAWPRKISFLPIIRQPEAIDSLLVVFAVIMYLLLANILGFPLVASIICSSLMFKMGVRFWMSILIGAGTALVTYFFFKHVLAVPLPSGIIF